MVIMQGMVPEYGISMSVAKFLEKACQVGLGLTKKPYFEANRAARYFPVWRWHLVKVAFEELKMMTEKKEKEEIKISGLVVRLH